MSFFSLQNLKSPNDTTIPFTVRRIPFTTAVVTLDTLQNFGMLAKGVRVVNNDVVNSVTVQLIDQWNPPLAIEPATEAATQEWTSFIRVTPNAVTGNGIIEIELVEQKDAYV